MTVPNFAKGLTFYSGIVSFGTATQTYSFKFDGLIPDSSDRSIFQLQTVTVEGHDVAADRPTCPSIRHITVLRSLSISISSVPLQSSGVYRSIPPDHHSVQEFYVLRLILVAGSSHKLCQPRVVRVYLVVSYIHCPS